MHRKKRSLTVVLCVAAGGTNFSALVIFMERNDEISPRVRAFIRVPDNVHIAATPNGWMTQQKVVSWFIECEKI